MRGGYEGEGIVKVTDQVGNSGRWVSEESKHIKVKTVNKYNEIKDKRI